MRLQELLDQIAVGAVNLDAVETGGKRVLRRLPIGVDNQRDFRRLEGARCFIGHRLAVRRPGFQVSDRHRRWRDRQHAARLERGMRDAPDMPELQEDDSAPGMDGVDHLTPARDLLLGVDAGHAGAAEAGFHDRRGFGDQQSARRRALGVIFRVQRPRRERRLGRPHPRQRRQRETMLELIGADLERRKQRWIVHVYFQNPVLIRICNCFSLFVKGSGGNLAARSRRASHPCRNRVPDRCLP